MIRALRAFALLLTAGTLGGFPAVLPAQQPAEVIPAPRFEIKRYEVAGNTLLPAGEVERLVAPHTGADKDFSDIQRALEALEQAYRALGYGVVQVLLPEQDITRGVVQFRVVQPKIGRVAVEGNTHFDTDNVRRSLPAVKEGEVPNSSEIARNLQLAAEHPVKQTNVLLRSGSSEEFVDVTVKVEDDKPWRGFFTLDNTGTGDTGYFRSGIGFQHTNLFNRDHSLTAQYITSPTNPSKVSIYGAGYRIPFYDLNSSLDLVAGYSDVDSGVVQGLFNVAGAGSIALARWNYILPKWNEIEHKVSAGLDYRAFENEVLLQGQNLTPDVVVHPLSLTYSGLRRMTASDLSFYGGISRNIPGGNDGKKEDWVAGTVARQAVTDEYTILRYGFNYARQFQSAWQVRVSFAGQYTPDALVSGEQFGIGGPDSVRGYNLREVASDRGQFVQTELYTPEFGGKVGLSDKYKLRALAFYDWGQVRLNKGLPGDITQDSLSSIGLGLRMSYGKTVNLRFDLANLLQDSPTLNNGSQRLTGSLAIVW